MTDRRALTTPAAPAAIGPYSQGVRAGGLLWTSGQIPLDPATGERVGADAAQQAEQVLDNLAAILAAAGCGFEDVIKTTVFLTDLDDFPAVNAVYARRFREPFPARSTVQVTALPRGVRVEIEAVAQLPNHRTSPGS